MARLQPLLDLRVVDLKEQCALLRLRVAALDNAVARPTDLDGLAHLDALDAVCVHQKKHTHTHRRRAKKKKRNNRTIKVSASGRRNVQLHSGEATSQERHNNTTWHTAASNGTAQQQCFAQHTHAWGMTASLALSRAAAQCAQRGYGRTTRVQCTTGIIDALRTTGGQVLLMAFALCVCEVVSLIVVQSQAQLTLNGTIVVVHNVGILSMCAHVSARC